MNFKFSKLFGFREGEEKLYKKGFVNNRREYGYWED